jgi:hypothetical protein
MIDEVQISHGVSRSQRLGRVPSSGVQLRLLSLHLSGNSVTLQWTAAHGGIYEVQWCPQPGSEWKALASVNATGQIAAWQETAPGRSDTPSGFYRIVMPL